MKDLRIPRSLLLLPLAALGLLAASTSGPAAPPAEGRVLVLGFDGADARTIRELVAKEPGRYPTFERLSAEGTFEPLEVEAPPESPVSWAALNTGQNPAKTGVPGFIKRETVGSNVQPGFGHLKKEEAPLERFGNVPIPTWSPAVFAGVAGAAGFLVGLLLFLVLFRKLAFAVPLGLVLGAAAAYGGLTVRGYLPETYPRYANPNLARNVWDFAAEGGKKCVVIDAAQAFDMPAPEGAKVLAGLGVPDARNGIGEWFVYTTDPNEVERAPKGKGTTTAGTVFRVDEYDGSIQTKVYGPENFWRKGQIGTRLAEIDEEFRAGSLSLDKSRSLSTEKQELEDEQAAMERTSVDMTIRVAGDHALVRIGDNEQRVEEGGWSDFFPVTFELNPLIQVDAITRVCVRYLQEPHFEMFMNVLDIDPRNPPFWQSISQPHGFSAELASYCGPYETYGWSTATMPFKDERISPEMLLQEVEFTLKWREDVTFKALEKEDWDFFMSVFSTTDRVQHMMYQYYDEGHPLYDPEAANRRTTFFGEEIRLADAVPAIYRQMDRVVGRALDEHVGPNDTLIVCSDHGFQSFRRQVNVNNWLAEKGYLAIKPGSGYSQKNFLLFVDWANTKLYSLGLGFVYVNRTDRDPKGIVDPDEIPALLDEVTRELLAATDPETGERFCREVYRTSEIHSGPHLGLEAELLLGFKAPYRVSWASSGGGLGWSRNEAGERVIAPVCLDNDSPWSGGHVSMALDQVEGVFFSNKKLTGQEGKVRSLNIAPTVLELLGVPIPAEMDLGPVSLE